MLFEKTAYENDFPLNLRIMRIKEYPIHYHCDIEFIYVLKGEIELKDVCSNYVLQKGDIFTINGHEVHGLKATNKENIVAVIQVSNRFFTKYFPDLPKACFMTGGKNDAHNKLEPLRKMLLHILLDYSKKTFNYKNDCIYQMTEAIKYLNEHFNLFAFDEKHILNFKNNNPIIVERISRIINYVYENHASKISLEELAEREHLSTYYLSHLIRENMGINFQEFLCFARVEMSEIPLLETEQKISTVAANVGFSTTSYYEKFFLKWFGHLPHEHRQLFSDRILSDNYPPCIDILSENQAVILLKHCLSIEDGQENSTSVIKRSHFNVNLPSIPSVLMHVQHALDVLVTQEDYYVMGERLFSFLYELNVSNVILTAPNPDNDAALTLLSNRLRFLGYNVSIASQSSLDAPVSFGCDSIAAAIHLFCSSFSSSNTELRLPLRDQGDLSIILKGSSACLTSCMVPKPSYYAYKLLRYIKGDLVAWGKYYYVIQTSTNRTISYVIVILHFNDEIQQICSRPATVHETHDILRDFMDELSIDFSIPVRPGKYLIGKYAFSNDNSVFGQMSHVDFLNRLPLPEEWMQLLNTTPLSQISTENADNFLRINASIKGAGIQIITATEMVPKS